MTIFEALESDVRSYSRAWPVVFGRGRGAHLYSEQGRPYLDFFAGAGALNYGHNEPAQKQALLDYITDDGVTHGLDMFTTAKRDFLETFSELILRPRGADYKVVFPGPGGTNAVEAALKLARRVSGRQLVISFTRGFHGMTLGALAVSGSERKRAAAGVPLTHVAAMPYDGYLGGDRGNDRPDFEYLEQLLSDPASGLDAPAAVIVETVQGEGGINVARVEWLRGLAELCRRYGVLLILDDVQMGCGRTGAFFSYEDAGIVPDMVCLSKSIGGYGLPLALTLIRPELDVWQPGDHNGTFRGVAPAFVTGAQALRTYWSDDVLEKSTRAKGERVAAALQRTAASFPSAGLKVRGRGLAWGLDLGAAGEPGTAAKVCAAAFGHGLLVETSGAQDEVIKLLPPLIIDDDDLDEGLQIIDYCVAGVLGASTTQGVHAVTARSATPATALGPAWGPRAGTARKDPTMSPGVPTVDLARWQNAPASERAAVSERLDDALRRTGMFLLRGHGVPREVVEGLRRHAREFFALPREVKARYAVDAACDGGWLEMHPGGGVGVEGDDGQVGGAPDLHESFYAGPAHRTGNPDQDRVNYPANRWPAELPELRTAVEAYTGYLLRVAQAVNELLAVTLGLPSDFFTARAARATWTQNLSLYPSLNAVGGVAAGQFRNGPHTDLGTFTVLSRQPGAGGLQGYDDHNGWFAPPHDPDAFIVNLGDLMELWTDGRWRALRHRVLPPSPSAPDEELLSLVFFFETDPDTIIEPLPAPMGGGRGLAPARARQTVLDKLGVTTGGEGDR